jgi:hypothetical protein
LSLIFIDSELNCNIAEYEEEDSDFAVSDRKRGNSRF